MQILTSNNSTDRSFPSCYLIVYATGGATDLRVTNCGGNNLPVTVGDLFELTQTFSGANQTYNLDWFFD